MSEKAPEIKRKQEASPEKETSTSNRMVSSAINVKFDEW